jgi:hypothetical protein
MDNEFVIFDDVLDRIVNDQEETQADPGVR